MLCNLDLQEEISGVTVAARIEAVTVSDNTVTLITFTTGRKLEEVMRDIGMRTRIYLLGKEGIL